ncbi:MAG: hypothetical protein LBC71_01225 [Oscillospiraceae bacterium]|jgi:hypothetical protein|nr:hypothetical protein [Oscillospiraceae bacterium]
MSSCSDYWCEHFGKNSNACDRCNDKEMSIDKPELRVILKKRAVEQMELSKIHTKNIGHER